MKLLLLLMQTHNRINKSHHHHLPRVYYYCRMDSSSSLEQDAARAVATSDLPRLRLCLEERPDLATRDDACIPLFFFVRERPRARAALLVAAILQARANTYKPTMAAAIVVLDHVATRYAEAHPPGSPMLLQTFDVDDEEEGYATTSQTPLDLAYNDDNRSICAVDIIQILLQRGLLTSTPQTVRPHWCSLLAQALWYASREPQFVARLLQAGFRLDESGNEDAFIVTACVHARPSVERAAVGLRLLLPVYAGRLRRLNDPAAVGDVMYELSLHVRAGRDVLELVDLLRALGLRLTHYVRERLGRMDTQILARIDAADATRVRSTLLARRALSQLPDDLRDRVALQASGGQPYSRRLVVVPPEVRRAHEAAAEADAQL
jgi:hypothetical protein